VELRDKQRRLVARHRLPYQFTSVPKRKPVKGRDESLSQYTSFQPQYPQQDPILTSATLERLAPTEGPVLGGLMVLLSGINFPSPPAYIYARFGALVIPTVCETTCSALDQGIDPILSTGVIRIRSNVFCPLPLIQEWSKSLCPYITTLKDPNLGKVTAGSDTHLPVNACASSNFPRRSYWLKDTH
jgi:hypothetical protein